jgi:hypothetical protein
VANVHARPVYETIPIAVIVESQCSGAVSDDYTSTAHTVTYKARVYRNRPGLSIKFNQKAFSILRKYLGSLLKDIEAISSGILTIRDRSLNSHPGPRRSLRVG